MCHARASEWPACPLRPAAGVGEAAAAHAVRALHPLGLPLLRQRLLHDGRPLRLQRGLLAHEGEGEVRLSAGGLGGLFRAPLWGFLFFKPWAVAQLYLSGRSGTEFQGVGARGCFLCDFFHLTLSGVFVYAVSIVSKIKRNVALELRLALVCFADRVLFGNDWVRNRKWPLLILPKTGLDFDCEMTVFPNFSGERGRSMTRCSPRESLKRETSGDSARLYNRPAARLFG